MSFYNHKEIEPKWQGYWAEHHTFKTGTDASKPKFYALDMFPYPSGAGLHVGQLMNMVYIENSRNQAHKEVPIIGPIKTTKAPLSDALVHAVRDFPLQAKFF